MKGVGGYSLNWIIQFSEATLLEILQEEAKKRTSKIKARVLNFNSKLCSTLFNFRAVFFLCAFMLYLTSLCGDHLITLHYYLLDTVCFLY